MEFISERITGSWLIALITLLDAGEFSWFDFLDESLVANPLDQGTRVGLDMTR